MNRSAFVLRFFQLIMTHFIFYLLAGMVVARSLLQVAIPNKFIDGKTHVIDTEMVDFKIEKFNWRPLG